MGVCGKFEEKKWRVCRGVVCLALGEGVVGVGRLRAYFVLLCHVLSCLVLCCVVLFWCRSSRSAQSNSPPLHTLACTTHKRISFFLSFVFLGLCLSWLCICLSCCSVFFVSVFFLLPFALLLFSSFLSFLPSFLLSAPVLILVPEFHMFRSSSCSCSPLSSSHCFMPVS